MTDPSTAMGLVPCDVCATLVLSEWAHTPHEDDCVAVGDGCQCDRLVCEKCCTDCNQCVNCGMHSGENHLWDCMGAWEMPSERVLVLSEWGIRLLPVLAVVLLAFVAMRSAW